MAEIGPEMSHENAGIVGMVGAGMRIVGMASRRGPMRGSGGMDGIRMSSSPIARKGAATALYTEDIPRATEAMTARCSRQGASLGCVLGMHRVREPGSMHPHGSMMGFR